jgi:arylsulfatase A-like enzyme
MATAVSTARVSPPRPALLGPRRALVMAAWFGLVAGYLDLGMIYLRRDVLHTTLYYEQSRHFRWTVPLANLILMLPPGLVLAGIGRARPRLASLQAAAWVYGTLAIWGPLLRTPLYGVASLVLALGVSRWISRSIGRHGPGFSRFAAYSACALAVLTAGVAVLSLSRQALAESRALAALPAAAAKMPNVLLIVMDTVRADHLGIYGYSRDTTPHLEVWAKRAVQFDWAFAPAPWTFPSHGSFLTGQWPSTLGAHWQPILDPGYPTLAAFLASRGYHTAGFAANTFWCSYESGMDRGFVRYEDYPLTARTILASTMPGRWLVERLRRPHDYYGIKWARAQSRDAGEINRSFLAWLARDRQPDRPFFAFLNYLDAHEPFMPPTGTSARFGLRAESRRDQNMLLQYWDRDKLTLGPRDVELARDSYDNCIAALDRELAALLDELERLAVLHDTVVIITSDHGEAFGEHGVFNHGFSVYSAEIHVPLLLISPRVPEGTKVSGAVTLRDLPATVAELTGLASGSPFPGESWARYWGSVSAGSASVGDQALSEVDIPMTIGPERGRGPRQRGFTISLVAEGLHYMLDMNGTEELYDLTNDPAERDDLRNDPGRKPALDRFRNRLAQIIAGNRPTNPTAAGYQDRFRTLLNSLIPPPRI